MREQPALLHDAKLEYEHIYHPAGGERPAAKPDGLSEIAGRVHVTTLIQADVLPAPGPHRIALTYRLLTSLGKKDLFVAILNANGEVQWCIGAGGPGDDSIFRADLGAIDRLFLVGSYEQDANFGSAHVSSKGGPGAYVAQLRLLDAFEWAISPTGSGKRLAIGVAADPLGFVYIAGYHEGTTSFGETTLTASSQDAFFAKINPSGSFVWAVSGGGSGRDTAGGTLLSSAGDVLVAGRYSGKATFPPLTVTNQNWADAAYVAAMDASGSFKWITSADGPGVSTYDFDVVRLEAF